ncbi:MAG: phage terminase large subunit family protein [Planctomycetes bacterium]|nr:phage terminase large subunit family protein [Planctomycetota bacterium]
MLGCPDCEHEFPLTLARYVKAGSGFYTCPACGAECHLELPGWLKAIERIVLIPGIVVCAVVGVVTHFIYGVALSLAWLALNIPMNVLLDGRLGWLTLLRPGRKTGAVPPPLPTAPENPGGTELDQR